MCQKVTKCPSAVMTQSADPGFSSARQDAQSLQGGKLICRHKQASLRDPITGKNVQACLVTAAQHPWHLARRNLCITSYRTNRFKPANGHLLDCMPCIFQGSSRLAIGCSGQHYSGRQAMGTICRSRKRSRIADVHLALRGQTGMAITNG